MTTTLEQLRREVKAAWKQACAADGIDPEAKFVVFTNTTEAAAYNELMGIYLRKRRLAAFHASPKAKRLMATITGEVR